MEDIQILDGEGSYMELVSGTVTDIVQRDDKKYIVTLQLDEFSAADFGESVLRFPMEYDPDNLGKTLYRKGDEIWVNFPGGMQLKGEPKLVTLVSNSGIQKHNQCTDAESYPGK